MCATSHVRHTGQPWPRAAGARPVTAGARSGLRGVAVQPLAPSLREPRCCIVLSGGSRCLHFPPSQRESNRSSLSVLPVPPNGPRVTSYDAPTATRIHDVNMTSTHFLAGPRSTCVGALENARVAESLRPEASIRYACHEAKEPSAPMSGLRRGSPALLREEATAAKRMPFLMVLGACDRLRRVGLTRGEQGAAPPRGE